MLRALPEPGLGLVTAGTGLAADKCRFSTQRSRSFAGFASTKLNNKTDGEYGHGYRCCEAKWQAP